MRDDVLVVSVLEQEPLGNHSKLRKSEFLVEFECRRICRNNRIELQNPKADFLGLREAILYEKFSDMLTALVLLDRIARIRNMSAAPDIVRVENVQPDHLAGVRINSDARERLRLEKGVTRLRVKRIFLRERDSVFDDIVPDFNRVVDIFFAVRFDFEHDKKLQKMNVMSFVSFPVPLSKP